MNQIVTADHEASHPVQAYAQPPLDPMMEVIATVVAQPDADIEKIEKMIELKERLDQTAAQKAFNFAMAAAQEQMPAIVARKTNKHTKSQYADLAAIYAEAKPIVSQFGLSFSTFPAQSDQDGCIGVSWTLRHAGGHVETGMADIPLDDRGSSGNANKTKTHAFGSSFTYARRYLFCMIFDIAIGKDDDGNAGGGTPVKTINDQQFIKIRDTAGELGIDEAVICKAEGIQKLHDLPAKRFDHVMRELETTRKNQTEQAEKEELSAELTED